MPTYDYECPKCGHTFEKFQGINDPPVKICPECGGRKVKRLIGTGGGIIFKGSGFYATDYRSDGYRRAARSDSSSGADSSAPAAASEKKSPPKTGNKAAQPAQPAAPGKKKA